jgi:hypothetical protein
LKRLADSPGAVILRPWYPVSALFRMQRESDGLQINFVSHINDAQSYEAVRAGSVSWQFGGQTLLVAAPGPSGIASANPTANRPPARRRITKKPTPRHHEDAPLREQRSAALKLESDRALLQLIRYRLSLPPDKRLNVLRRKIGLRATCL